MRQTMQIFVQQLNCHSKTWKHDNLEHDYSFFDIPDVPIYLRRQCCLPSIGPLPHRLTTSISNSFILPGSLCLCLSPQLSDWTWRWLGQGRPRECSQASECVKWCLLETPNKWHAATQRHILYVMTFTAWAYKTIDFPSAFLFSIDFFWLGFGLGTK